MQILSLISISEVLTILFRTLIIFFFAFLVIRFLGKRQLAHLTYLDLLLIIALGSAVGDVMIYKEDISQMVASMIAILTVGVFVKILNEFTSHSKKINALLLGTARLVIDEGVIKYEALSHEDVSEDELMSLLRIKGVESVKDVKKAFLEADGDLSIIYKNHKTKK